MVLVQEGSVLDVQEREQSITYKVDQKGWSKDSSRCMLYSSWAKGVAHVSSLHTSIDNAKVQRCKCEAVLSVHLACIHTQQSPPNIMHVCHHREKVYFVQNI
jgi:hypothetical protein